MKAEQELELVVTKGKDRRGRQREREERVQKGGQLRKEGKQKERGSDLLDKTTR